jgi:SAM-dependent methyltransferase
MLQEARRLHRGVDLVAADAAGLLPFMNSSFDAVVFSYNGIDYLHPDSARHRCLSEVHRVLRADGVFVFSTHNPRSLVALPTGDRAVRRLGVVAYVTARRVARLVPTRAFQRGDGYVVDPAQSGLTTHSATRRRVIRDTTAAGFQHRDTLGGDHPRRSGALWTPWWYYVFTRP